MRLALLVSGLGILLLAAAGLAGLNGGRARAQTTTTIEVHSYYFCDQSFSGGVCEKTVALGDTVKWEFMAGPHTVTQCDDTFTTCPPAGGFDSGTHSAGQEFSQTFNTAGTFSYRCNIHPSQMRGRITVVAPATPTPSAAPTASGAPTPPPAPAASPAAVPKTGGQPGGGADGLPWAAALALFGGLLALAGGGLTAVLMRRRQP